MLNSSVLFPDSISLLEGSCLPVGRPLIYSLIYRRQFCCALDIITLACVCWLISLSSAALGRAKSFYVVLFTFYQTVLVLILFAPFYCLVALVPLVSLDSLRFVIEYGLMVRIFVQSVK